MRTIGERWSAEDVWVRPKDRSSRKRRRSFAGDRSPEIARRSSFAGGRSSKIVRRKSFVEDRSPEIVRVRQCLFVVACSELPLPDAKTFTSPLTLISTPLGSFRNSVCDLVARRLLTLT